jgi:hypothetical protein
LERHDDEIVEDLTAQPPRAAASCWESVANHDVARNGEPLRSSPPEDELFNDGRRARGEVSGAPPLEEPLSIELSQPRISPARAGTFDSAALSEFAARPDSTSCASTTAIAATLTISSTSAPR